MCFRASRIQKGKSRGETAMIRVVRLNGEVLYLNYLQIELIECIPETKIRLMNGDYYVVRDSVDSINQQIQSFLKGCLYYENKCK